MTRRQFAEQACRACAAAALTGPFLDLFGSRRAFAEKGNTGSMREAMFYERLEAETVQCNVCFRRCVARPGQRGFCRNKENIEGTFYNLVHGRPSAIQVDPIEKEPALHMLPGTFILALGTAGCNFRCKFCHNWHLSQRPLEEMARTYSLSPEQAVALAQDRKIPTVSFTYNEPTSFYEYAYDIAREAKKNGVRVLWHTNGALNPEPLRALLAHTDAVTVDLKGFTASFYREVTGGRLEPVLESLKIIRGEGVWLEVVHLHIPTLNDDPDDVRRMCVWVKDHLGEHTPVHFSRFFPNYRLTSLAATPIASLERAHAIARGCGLQFVTIGNVPGHRHNSTFCPGCGKVLIRRSHFSVRGNNLKDGRCRSCGRAIPGIWT